MIEGKKRKMDEIIEIYNTDLIFSRVTYLLSMNQLDFKILFNYELAPTPTSMFKDTGEARYTKSKADMKNTLKVEVSSRTVKPDAIIIDGGGMLHSAIYWPSEGTVKNLIDGVEEYIAKMASTADVYIIFDRYMPFSIKSDTRIERVGALRRKHTLSIGGPLPAREICLSSNETKQNLIEIITDTLVESFSKTSHPHKIVFTSKHLCPGKKEASEDDFVMEGKLFVAQCHGITNESSSSKNRYLIFY